MTRDDQRRPNSNKIKTVDERVTEVLEDVMSEDLNPAIGLAFRLALYEAGLKIVEA